MRVVSFVLYVIDDLTNRPVTRGQIRAFAESEPLCHPVYKDGGWICFVDMPEGRHTITLEGKLYEKQWITIDMQESADGEEQGMADCPIVTVRMQPSKNCPIPVNCACVLGKAQPESFVRAVFKSLGNPLRLLEDYRGGRCIRLFLTEPICPEGCSFMVDEGEFFTVTRAVDEQAGIYMIDRELVKAYKKGSTVIWFAAKVRSDEDGRFRFVFKCYNGSKYLVRLINQENMTVELEVEAGAQAFANFKGGQD